MNTLFRKDIPNCMNIDTIYVPFLNPGILDGPSDNFW